MKCSIIKKILMNYARYALLYTFQFESLLWVINQLVPQFFLVYPTVQSIRNRQSELQLIVVMIEKFAQQGLSMHGLYFILIVITNILIYGIISILVMYNCMQRQQQSKIEQILYKILVRLPNFITEGLFQLMLLQNLWHLQFELEQEAYLKAITILLFTNLLFILSLLQFFIGEAALTQFISQYKRIQKSNLDYIKYFTLIFQCFLFVFITTSEYIFQSILYLMYSIIELSRIFITLSFQNNTQVQIKLIQLSIGLIICILNFTNSVNRHSVYCILLIPLLAVILIHAYSYRTNQILKTKIQSLNLHELNFLLCYSEILIQGKIKKKNQVWIAIMTLELRKQFNEDAYYIKNCCFLNDNSEVRSHQLYVHQYLILQIKKYHIKLLSQNIYLYSHLIYLHYTLGLQNETYKLIHHLSNLNLDNYFEKILISTFIIILNNNLQKMFISKIKGQQKHLNKLSLAVQQFIKDENFNSEIRLAIMTQIYKKITILLQFNKLSNSMYSKIIDFIADMIKLQKSLEDNFARIASQKNLAMLVYFLAEVKNDWCKAHEISINGNLNCENYYSNDTLLTKEKKIIFMKFSYENYELSMINYSKDSPGFFGYYQHQFNQIIDPKILMPKGVREYHNSYILNFIESGKGIYFKSKGENICQLRNGFIQSVQFFYDVQFEQNQLFKFIVFFTEPEEQQAIIVIDSNHKIEGISQQLLKTLNYPKTIYEDEIIDGLYDLPVSLFIEDLCFTNNQPQQRYKISFPNTYTYVGLKNMSMQQRIHSLQQQRNLQNFSFMSNVTRRQGYSILKVSMVQELECNLETIVEIQDDTLNMQLNEDETIIKPYNDLYDIMYQIDIHQPFDTARNNTDKSRGQTMINKENDRDSFNDNNSAPEVENNVKLDYRVSKESNGVSISSTLGGLQHSYYVKKYTLYSQLSNSELLGSSISTLILMWFAIAAYILAFITIQLIMIKQDFTAMFDFYGQVQVNNYFIEPLQKFFLSRYMQQEYAYLYSNGDIVFDKYNYFQLFYRPLQKEGYTTCKQNYQDHFSDAILQEFIKDIYLEIKLQNHHYKPVTFDTVNLTLQSAYDQLLESFYSQYYIYSNNISSSTLKGISPYNTFQYLNYITFINTFDIISNFVFEEGNKQISIIKTKWTLLPVPILAFGIVLILFQFIPLRKLIAIIESIISLIGYIDNASLEYEIQRLQFLYNNLKSLSDYLHCYKFNILSKEKHLIEQQTRQQTKTGIKNKITSRKVDSQKITMKRIYFWALILYFIMLLVFITQTISQIGVGYFQKFPLTYSFFKLLADIGVYIPAAYSQRDFIFFWSYFSYFNNTDREAIYQQITLAQNHLEQFLVYDAPGNEFLFSDQFFQYYTNYQQSDLCQLLNKSLFYDSDSFCYQSRDGILKRGLTPVLSNLNIQIKNELLSNFTQRSKPIPFELEAVYMCSSIMTKLISEMSFDIDEQINLIKLILQIISLILFSYTCLQSLLIQLYLVPYLKHLFVNAKQITFLLPQGTIFINDQYERELRRISVLESLI